jgi:hypothetical protein
MGSQRECSEDRKASSLHFPGLILLGTRVLFSVVRSLQGNMLFHLCNDPGNRRQARCFTNIVELVGGATMIETDVQQNWEHVQEIDCWG